MARPCGPSRQPQSLPRPRSRSVQVLNGVRPMPRRARQHTRCVANRPLAVGQPNDARHAAPCSCTCPPSRATPPRRRWFWHCRLDASRGSVGAHHVVRKFKKFRPDDSQAGRRGGDQWQLARRSAGAVRRTDSSHRRHARRSRAAGKRSRIVRRSVMSAAHLVACSWMTSGRAGSGCSHFRISSVIV